MSLGARTGGSLVERLSRDAKPAVWPGGCLRRGAVHDLRRPCAECLAVCPAGLDLGDPGVTLDGCLGCRQCVVACPTGALVDGPAVRRRMLAAWREVRPGGTFTIACDVARVAPELRLPCTSGVEWEALVVPALLGASEVVVIQGDCAACPMGSPSAAPEDRAISVATSVLEALGSSASIRREQADRARAPKAPSVGPVRSRRELFGALLGGRRGAHTRPTPARGVGLPEGVSERITRGGPRWMRDVVAALVDRGAHGRGRVAGRGGLASVRFHATRCDGCGVCAAACPSAALSTHAGRLVFYEHRCSACGLCEQACAPAAIEVRAEATPGAWSVRRPSLVHEPSQGHCRQCGQPALSPALGLCARCYREGGGLGLHARGGRSRARGPAP